jgi:excisionase family DNA binding protein
MTDKPLSGRRRRAPSDHVERAHWTMNALADRWAISARTVRRLIERGELRAIRVGGQLRISPETIERFEERHEAHRD